MNFENEAPDWEATGTEPEDSLKSTGFTAGYKPPASIFNWFWTKVGKCISELQSKLSSHAEIDDGTTAEGLANETNYGHVMLTDEVSSSYSTSSGLAATPAAVQTRAPTNHRSSGSTYGMGTNSYYGHVKLSDATDGANTQTSGVAATPYAVKQAYDVATEAQETAETAAENSELENYYPEYHADDVDSTTEFYLDCANVDNAGTALFKATARDVTSWVDLKSGKGFAITDSNISSNGIISTSTGALTATLSSYAGFNTSSNFTILFDASIPQQSSSDDATVLFQLGSNRVLQIHQKGVDGIRLVTYDADSTAHVYPAKLESGSTLDGGSYTTGHYVVPLDSTFSAQGYGSYQHFAVVFDTDNETVTWYQNGSVYSTSDMEDTYVKVDGGYSAKILENVGSGLRYLKIVRKAMTQAEIIGYASLHPDTNYTGQPKTQYDNKLLDLEEGLRYFGTCTTAAATKTKTVTVDDGFEPIKGVRIAVKFENTNTASNAMLVVNLTGGHVIYFNGAVASSNNSWCANEVVEFVYDGNYFHGKGSGVGTSSQYGHVRLSDSTTSTYSTSGGYAATPSAVKAAYDLATTANTAAANLETIINNINKATEVSLASVKNLIVTCYNVIMGGIYFLPADETEWADANAGNDTIADEDGNQWVTYNADGSSQQSIAGGTSYVFELTSDGKALILASGTSTFCLVGDSGIYFNL